MSKLFHLHCLFLEAGPEVWSNEVRTIKDLPERKEFLMKFVSKRKWFGPGRISLYW